MCIWEGQRQHSPDMLTGDAQRGLAGYKDFEPWRVLQQVHEVRRRSSYVLEIVKQEQRLLLLKHTHEGIAERLPASLRHLQGLGDGGQDELRIPDRRQWHPVHA